MRIIAHAFLFLVAFILSFTQGTVLTVGPSSVYNNISAAIADAVDNDIIELEAQTYNGNLNRNFDFTGFANISVVGQGSALTTIDCELGSRFFYLLSSVSERNIQLSGLRLYRCKVNVGTLYGGAIYIKNNFTSITLNDVIFDSCTTNQGGAFYAEGYDGDNATLGHLANIRMNNVHFINNTANIGGAVWFVRAQTFWSSGSARNNSATTNGGALWFDDYSELHIDSVVFQFNQADRGGALRFENIALFNGTNVQFLDNSAVREGGAIWTLRALVYCTGCYTSRNYAANGATFYFSAGTVEFTSSTFDGGHALIEGGFAEVYNSADMKLFDCTVRFFSASKGGAFMVSQQAYLYLERTTVANNSALGDGEGGAIYVIYKSDLKFVDSTIIDNNAASEGAGIWCADSDIDLDDDTQFISNEAPSDNDIHCSQIISGTNCDVKGGDFDGLCDVARVKEPFKTGYIILIAVVGGLVLIMILIAVTVLYFRKDRQKKIKSGKLWENMEEKNEEKPEKDAEAPISKTEPKHESKRDSKRNSKRDSKRESKKTEESSRDSLQESQASEKKSESSSSDSE